MVDALAAAITACEARGDTTSLQVLAGSCYVQVARNELVKKFRDEAGDVALFWDDDISLAASDVLKLIDSPDEVTGVTYRYKTHIEDYPVVIRTSEEGFPKVRADGCIEAVGLPTGMLAVKRSAIEKLVATHPERAYFKRQNGILLDGFVDLFPQGIRDGQWVGEDYAFCRLWTDLGETMWLVPDVDISHWAKTEEFKGNYHKFLLRQPRGRDAAPFALEKAGEVGGFLSLSEGAWLAEQAKKHKVIVEIGSFLGRSTRAMADNTDGVIFAVDNWEGPQEARLGTDEVFKQFSENLKEHIASGKVIPITADHADWPALDAIPSPDMVFIDGDHSSAAVRRDIDYWTRRLQRGGLLCGHDADWSGVKEMLPRESTLIEGTSLWALFHAACATQSR